MAALFESAAAGELGSSAPAYPEIGVGNPSTSTVPATIPCTLLKSIGWTESAWTQFCASSCGQSGATIISFDCGFGVTQITSGMSTGSMGSFLFDPARVASETDYNIGTGAGILAAKWRVVPYIGDNQPDIVEHWYYATWAYNGFAYVNNPNNPLYPAGRAPYNGPSGLARGNYPYQEIVWGLMHNPPSALWEPLEASYPDALAVGSDADDIPAPSPEHTDPCGAVDFVVDDQDLEFGFIQGDGMAEQALTGGWDGAFYFQDPYSGDVPYVIGRWWPDVPSTGLYALDHWVPSSSDAASTNSSFDIAFQGGHFMATVNQSVSTGDWVELAAGYSFKFVEGQVGQVTLSNLSQGDPDEPLAWDALRWRWVGDVGTLAEGDLCSSSAVCDGSMVCVDGACAEACSTAGCTEGLCEAATGICVGSSGDDDDVGDDDDTAPPTDTDQDGIPDNEEGPGDADGDGVPNWWDLDSDGDGLSDAVEGSGDTDGDGVPDYLDEDSDDDGIPDQEEGDHDSDGDGLMNSVDEDSDGDGIPDADEGTGDSDGDGIPDYLDDDTEGDGDDDSDNAGDQNWGGEGSGSRSEFDGAAGCACFQAGIPARSPRVLWGVTLLLLACCCTARRRGRRGARGRGLRT